MVQVPIHRNYVAVGGLLIAAALAAAIFIPYRHHATPLGVQDQQGSVQDEQAAPVLSIAADDPLGAGDLTVNGMSVPVKEGTQQINTPGGTATVSVSGNSANNSNPPQTTQSSSNSNVNIRVTTQNTNAAPNSSTSTSFASSSSSSHGSTFSNVSVYGTANGNVNVQLSK